MTLERSGCALKCRSSRTLKAKSIFQFIFARTQNRSTLKCNFLFKRQFLAGATSFLSPILARAVFTDMKTRHHDFRFNNQHKSQWNNVFEDIHIFPIVVIIS